MEEFGKALVVEPYLGDGGDRRRLPEARRAGWRRPTLIGQIIAGEATFAFAWAEPQGRYCAQRHQDDTARKEGGGCVLNGHKAVVVGAPFASHLIVTARTGGGQRDTGGVSVFLVDKARQGRRQPRLSDRRRPARLGGRFENVGSRRRGADRRRRATALPLGGAGGRRGHRGDLRRGLRRAAQAARGHAGIHQAAQAVRRADRLLPGAAAPHGRHVHPASSRRSR